MAFGKQGERVTVRISLRVRVRVGTRAWGCARKGMGLCKKRFQQQHVSEGGGSRRRAEEGDRRDWGGWISEEGARASYVDEEGVVGT
jgi:hypothetical protein